jgi:formylmethanofuran dehydrogenase subunit E
MLYFSLFSGEIFDSPVELNDAFQIPLKQMPVKSCKKCYGRFYQYYNVTHKHYEICNKCAKKCIDPHRLLDKLDKFKKK